MILAPSFESAVEQAHTEASATARRQRITRRPVLRDGLPWWVIEPAHPARLDDALDLPPVLLTPGRPAGERIPLGDINLARYSHD